MGDTQFLNGEVVVLPNVPADVQRDATKMFARHNELKFHVI